MRNALEALRFIWYHPANRGSRMRAVLRAIAFQVRGRLFGRPTIAPIGTHSRISVAPGHGQAGLVYANPTEAPEINVWQRELNGGLFVDVGANVGAYSIWAIEAGCEVLAIEPDSWAVQQLRGNLALNGYTADVVHAAAGATSGTVLVTSDRGVTNRIVGPDHAGPTQQVRCVTLDELIGERAVAGLKIDVEGAELDVLRGADEALASKRIALMQIEWTGASTAFGVRREEIAAHLDDRGYELLTPSPDGSLRPVEHTGPQQPDLFARPR